jgi:putative addiction module CopG family antidote
MATKAVQLEDDLPVLIDSKVVEYGYASASSYVRDLIRRDEARIEWLRAEIQRGFDSGTSPYTVEQAFEAGFERARRKCA